MNNYSLGGFDPSLVEQIYNYVQPSPFATSAMRDPSLVGQTSEMLTRLSYPNDKLAPPTYSDVSMPSGQPEHDALDVIGAIFKAPFRLIGAAKNGLEEAIGHPNADKRAMQDEFVRQRELAILASNAVSQQEKQMLFPTPTRRTGRPLRRRRRVATRGPRGAIRAITLSRSRARSACPSGSSATSRRCATSRWRASRRSRR